MRKLISRAIDRPLQIIALILLSFGLSATHYTFSNDPIDVVIPAIKKDLSTLDLAIEGIRNNGENIRRVIVISNEKLTDKAEWFDEALFPFSKDIVSYYICHSDIEQSFYYMQIGRSGWFLQQLLKFYAPYIIPGISSNVLVLDSDTIFLRPVSFLNSENGALFNSSSEYHHPYFVHARKLIPGFKRVHQASGICHHMLFQKPILDDLFDRVEKAHGMPFWQAFCHFVNKGEMSGASEYEIYFNFALRETGQVTIRHLKGENINSLDLIDRYKNEGYDYVACHSWLRDLLENEKQAEQ